MNDTLNEEVIFLPRNSTYDMEQLTDPAYYILISLITPRHGYGIMKFISELTEEEVTIGPATLYTLIKKMQQADYITLNDDNDDRRKTYTLTVKGHAMIVSEIERRSRMARHGMIAIDQSKGANSHGKE